MHEHDDDKAARIRSPAALSESTKNEERRGAQLIVDLLFVLCAISYVAYLYVPRIYIIIVNR